MSDKTPSPFDILDFWWKAGPPKWFQRSDAFDAEIRDNYLAAYQHAADGHLDSWCATPHGMLALILLIDQFPRNMFRDDPQTFATDGKALELAQLSLERGFHRAFPNPAKAFFFLPFEHAEDMPAQETSVDLFREHTDEQGLLYALIHLDVIRRFGRFPHRNKVLGRETTAEEQRYLDTGGFGA